MGLKKPELLNIEIENGAVSSGGSQYWYPSEGFIPPGACGATAASNVLAYLLWTRRALYDIAKKSGLPAPDEHVSKKIFLDFMKIIYQFLYPRLGGLMADGFVEGIDELARKYTLPIKAKCLKIPINRSKRPVIGEVNAFIKKSLENDIPVAFLILSKGCVSVLDTWHWVTVLGLDERRGTVQITDNGKVFWADLNPWLETSIMGGAFVTLIVTE